MNFPKIREGPNTYLPFIELVESEYCIMVESYAECHYADCRYAECHYADCRYAECHYADCRYAECCK